MIPSSANGDKAAIWRRDVALAKEVLSKGHDGAILLKSERMNPAGSDLHKAAGYVTADYLFSPADDRAIGQGRLPKASQTNGSNRHKQYQIFLKTISESHFSTSFILFSKTDVHRFIRLWQIYPPPADKYCFILQKSISFIGTKVKHFRPVFLEFLLYVQDMLHPL
jgi:hypothetical protein